MWCVGAPLSSQNSKKKRKKKTETAGDKIFLHGEKFCCNSEGKRWINLIASDQKLYIPVLIPTDDTHPLYYRRQSLTDEFVVCYVVLLFHCYCVSEKYPTNYSQPTSTYPIYSSFILYDLLSLFSLIRPLLSPLFNTHLHFTRIYSIRFIDIIKYGGSDCYKKNC